MLGQLGLGRLFIKIDAEATLEPKANIRHLTFHYRQIFKGPFGFVGSLALLSLTSTAGSEVAGVFGAAAAAAEPVGSRGEVSVLFAAVVPSTAAAPGAPAAAACGFSAKFAA